MNENTLKCAAYEGQSRVGNNTCEEQSEAHRGDYEKFHRTHHGPDVSAGEMIEAEHQTQVVYNAEMVQELFH